MEKTRRGGIEKMLLVSSLFLDEHLQGDHLKLFFTIFLTREFYLQMRQ